MSRILLSVALSVGLVACAEEAPPEVGVEEGAVVTKVTCDPNSQEPPPRPGGSCTYEISLDEVSNLIGQGASDPDMELNVHASADASAVNWPGAMPATAEFTAGMTRAVGRGNVIASYTVQIGQQRQVQLCADFTEVDSGLNGGDDHGHACKTITLRADAGPSPGSVVCPSEAKPAVASTMCGPNQCNGKFGAQFEVMVADSDGDGVNNDFDFTPDVCDEEHKGKLGRASLIWDYYGNGPMTRFFQDAGPDLMKAEKDYDFVVLVIDPNFAGPVLENATAIDGADLVLSPQEANLYLGMQEITRRGFDMDVWVFSHGTDLTGNSGITRTDFSSDDAKECTGLPGGEICGNGNDDDGDGHTDEAPCAQLPIAEVCRNAIDDDGDGIVDEQTGVWDHELVQNLASSRIGTYLVPIRMVYSIACFNEGLNWAWQFVGAKVTSGTEHINFFPTFFGGFADAWNTASDYATSVNLSAKPGDHFWSLAYMETQALTVDCDDVSGNPPGSEELWSVTARNACAHDFFHDDDGGGNADDAVYNIVPYDNGKSGADNMDIESTRVTAGDATIKKFAPATLTW
jgi:hypothetical protein